MNQVGIGESGAALDVEKWKNSFIRCWIAFNHSLHADYLMHTIYLRALFMRRDLNVLYMSFFKRFFGSGASFLNYTHLWDSIHYHKEFKFPILIVCLSLVVVAHWWKSKCSVMMRIGPQDTSFLIRNERKDKGVEEMRYKAVEVSG